MAKENNIHILCLPSHTTHLLQPLDVGVFISFKHHIGRALNTLLRSSPGCVPTSEDIPNILSQAWPASMTAINFMSGFRKTGIYPLNPGSIKDRECAPAKGITDTSFGSITGLCDTSTSTDNSIETHAPSSGVSILSDCTSPDSVLSQAMDSLFIKPQLKRKSTRRCKPAYNHTTVCITENQFLEKLKEDKNYNSKKPLATKRRQNKAPSSKLVPKGKPPPKGRGTKIQQDSSQAESKSDCECPVCGQHNGDKIAVWIQCDKCEDWYDTECAGLDSDSLPNTHVCGNCI